MATPSTAALIALGQVPSFRVMAEPPTSRALLVPSRAWTTATRSASSCPRVARRSPRRLPAHGGQRRVAGLRREEVALLAGVSVDYYVRLERGNLGGVSESVLDAIARALQLDEAERGHLFDLARSANTQ